MDNTEVEHATYGTYNANGTFWFVCNCRFVNGQAATVGIFKVSDSEQDLTSGRFIKFSEQPQVFGGKRFSWPLSDDVAAWLGETESKWNIRCTFSDINEEFKSQFPTRFIVTFDSAETAMEFSLAFA